MNGDAVYNSLEDSLSHNLTYRAIIRQQAQLSSEDETKPNQLKDARTPWHW